MQPVRVKQPRRMVWVFILALVILAMAAVVVWMLYPRDNTPLSPALYRQDEAVTLIDRDESTLLRMEVMASEGSSFTLIRQGDSFAVEGDAGFPLEEREISLMVKDLTILAAHGIAGEAYPGGDLSPLGFTHTSPKVRAVYAGGQSVTLLFGGDARTEIPADYLMVEGDSNVYLVSQETNDHFDRLLETLHPVPEIDFTPSLLDAMRVEGSDPFTLTHSEGLWMLAEPVGHPADEVKVAAILQGIGKMRLAVYAGEATAENLERFGFAPARRKVIFTLAESEIAGFDALGNTVGTDVVAAQQISLSIGADIPPIGFYALYGGEIYQASAASMGFLRDTTSYSLLARAPVTVPMNRLFKINVSKAGQRREYLVELVESILPNNEIQTDDAGNILYQSVITLDGEDVSDAFIREYIELMRLSAAGELPGGYAPAGEPVREITLTGQGIHLTLTFNPYDPLHYAMGVNGHYLFYVERQPADAIEI